MKGFVRGFIEGLGGNFREIVFYKRCSSRENLVKAFEDALDSPATTILAEKEDEQRPKPV